MWIFLWVSASYLRNNRRRAQFRTAIISWKCVFIFIIQYFTFPSLGTVRVSGIAGQIPGNVHKSSGMAPRFPLGSAVSAYFVYQC